MQQVGVDPETGEFDSDVVTTGQSQTQKQRRAAILSAFEETNDSLTIDELTSILDGYDDSKIINQLDKLYECGDVYRPEDGHYRAT
jgi:replicative DNA helicase Mcm